MAREMTLGHGVLEELQEAVNERISELKQLVLLRVDDKTKGLYEADLRGIAASVSALSKSVEDLKARIAAEKAALPKARALIEASKVQRRHIEQIEASMPQRLPQRPASCAQGVVPATGRPAAPAVKPADTEPSTAGVTSRVGPSAPRRYVTKTELENAPSYMRGRLPLEKVNAALEELVGFANANHKFLASFKAGKVSGPERVRATNLLHNVASKEGIKGSFWFMDSEMQGSHLKHDQTSKSILAVLRHTGRIKEVRVNLDGVGHTVYVLLE